MQIGEVVRENRKRKNGIQEKLTAEEITSIIYEGEAKLKTESYEQAFQWAKSMIERYPHCDALVWQMAVLIDAWRGIKEIPDSEKYDQYINKCYVRALESEDEYIRKRAADSLFGFYSSKEQYDKAEEYLNYFSKENPERKRKQAYLYSKTNKVELAYKEYEEILFSSYQMVSMVLQSMYALAMQDHENDKAYLLAKKQQQLASVFEMGKYHEMACMLERVTWEKNEFETIEIMEQMLDSVDQINGFKKSKLYSHMSFKETSDHFSKELYENLLECFRDEETYGYMKGNSRWRKLVKQNVEK